QLHGALVIAGELEQAQVLRHALDDGDAGYAKNRQRHQHFEQGEPPLTRCHSRTIRTRPVQHLLLQAAGHLAHASSRLGTIKPYDGPAIRAPRARVRLEPDYLCIVIWPPLSVSLPESYAVSRRIWYLPTPFPPSWTSIR